MDELDALVICAEAVPLPQALSLMAWWVAAEPRALLHPSVNWWVVKHAPAVAKIMRDKYWRENLR